MEQLVARRAQVEQNQLPMNGSALFIGYGSEIHLIETAKRQRKPASAAYREAWELILQWAAQAEMPE